MTTLRSATGLGRRSTTGPRLRSGTPAVAAMAAMAPIVWGTTYLVTTQLLPPGRPMTTSVLRALPAGVLLLCLAPGLPKRGWRWKTVVLGILNIGAFFPLLFVAAYRLPGGLASVVGSLQPLVITLITVALGWRRPPGRQVGLALAAACGVALTTLTARAHLDPVGIMAAIAGTISMACGILLSSRWGVAPGSRPLNSTAWQLIIGAVVITPLVPLVDQGTWYLDPGACAGYLWLTLVGGALGYAVWLRGARSLPPTNMALLGTLSPLTAAILGWVVLGQALTALQCFGFVIALGGATAGQFFRSTETDQQAAVRAAFASSARRPHLRSPR